MSENEKPDAHTASDEALPDSDGGADLESLLNAKLTQFMQALEERTGQQISQAVDRLEARINEIGSHADPLRTRPLSDLDQNSQDAAQLNDYGVQLYYCNELLQSVQILEEAVEKSHDMPEIWNNLAVVYTAVGQTEKSILAFQKAAELDPYHVDVLNNRGVLALLEATPERALELLEEAGNTNPRSIPILLNLAQAHQALGQEDKAVQIWKRVKAIDPANDEATQFLRQYYADTDH